jgi:3-deoxy-D-manno-octulosonic-acid transferase
MLKRGDYKSTLLNRIGCIAYPLLQKKAGRKRIWIQAISVGELKSIKTLIDRLSAEPTIEIVLTTTTSTAYRLALEWFSGKVIYIGAFPLDFWPCSARTWKQIQPDICFLTEQDLWPEHLHQASMRKIPIWLLNGRISTRSFNRYKRVNFLIRPLIQPITRLLAESPEAAARYIALGIDSSKVEYVGNLKFDLTLGNILSDEVKTALKQKCGFTQEQLLVIGASTWEGEEEMLLEMLQSALDQGLNCGLIIVPRHVERMKDLVPILNKYRFKWSFYTESGKNDDTQVYIVDKTGVLTQFLQIAAIAFIGKSLSPHIGGQTPIEAAAAGLPVVYGPNMQNFNFVCQSLESSEASIRTQSATEAQEIILTLLTNAEKRVNVSKQATIWYHQHQGATDKTFTRIIRELL